MIQPSLQDVIELAGQGTVIPVCKDILADLLTPAAAFLRIAHGRRRAFLLESVEGGERLARYSFIGWDPFLMVIQNIYYSPGQTGIDYIKFFIFFRPVNTSEVINDIRFN